MDKFTNYAQGPNIIEEKLKYFKNLKPKTGIFKIHEMDPNQLIIQETHAKNKQF